MKHVRCNHCNNEYYIEESLEKLGFPLGGKQCEICGETDYLIIDNDVNVEYSDDECAEPSQRADDLLRNLSIIREELKGIIDNYIDPYFK